MYQLRHNELSRVVSIQKLESLSQPHNAYGDNSFFSLVFLESELERHYVSEKLKINQRFFVKFLANRQYLSFNKEGKVLLTEEPGIISYF